MAVLLIGTGFVGGYVVRELTGHGEEVVCYDLAPNDSYIETLVPSDKRTSVTIVRGDVCDLARLLHTIRDKKITKVVHLAGLLLAASRDNVLQAASVNVDGTAVVLEAARLANLEKVVWASSLAVFGRRSQSPSGVLSNDSPFDPENIYGAFKVMGEHLLRHYADVCDVNATGLRLSSTYGWGKYLTAARGTGLSWLTELIDKPAQGLGPSYVPCGDGDMDFLYVADVARAVRLALACSAPSGASYLITGDRRPVAEAFEYVRSLLPSADMKLLPGKDGPLRRFSEPITFDVTTTLRDIGYEPVFTMEEGLRAGIDLAKASVSSSRT